jgi:hypothetical protein
MSLTPPTASAPAATGGALTKAREAISLDPIGYLKDLNASLQPDDYGQMMPSHAAGVKASKSTIAFPSDKSADIARKGLAPLVPIVKTLNLADWVTNAAQAYMAGTGDKKAMDTVTGLVAQAMRNLPISQGVAPEGKGAARLGAPADQTDFDAFMQTYSAATGIRDVSEEMAATPTQDLAVRQKAYNDTVTGFTQYFQQVKPNKLQMKHAIDKMREAVPAEEGVTVEGTAKDVTGQKQIELRQAEAPAPEIIDPFDEISETLKEKRGKATRLAISEEEPPKKSASEIRGGTPIVDPLEENASGQTDVSLEAVREQKARIKGGIASVIIDSRSGKERPAIGIRPEDNTLNPYDVLVQRDGDGKQTIINKGDKAKPLPEAPKRDKESRKGSKGKKQPVPADNEPAAAETVSTVQNVDAPASDELPRLRPALRSGSDTVIGEVGSDHPSILEANPDMPENSERMFAKPDGELVTRDEGAEFLKKENPAVYDEWEKAHPGEDLHSKDMNAAVEKVEGKQITKKPAPEPNTILTQVNDLNGEPMGYEVSKHDGTPEGMHEAAKKNAKAMNKYKDASNNETIHLVIDKDGKPAGTINARFGDVTPLPPVPDKVPAEGGGVKYQTGKPVKMGYIWNTEKAPNMGERFGQHLEPAGRYINERPITFKGDDYPNLKEGEVEFKNPLVVGWGGGYGEPDNWKQALSDKYGGKKGKALSKALIKDGYDGIITLDAKGNTSEIVDLVPDKPASKEVAKEEETARADYEAARVEDKPEEVVDEAVQTAKKEGTPLKEQKKYLIANIDEAIKEAPEFHEDMEGFNKLTDHRAAKRQAHDDALSEKEKAQGEIELSQRWLDEGGVGEYKFTDVEIAREKQKLADAKARYEKSLPEIERTKKELAPVNKEVADRFMVTIDVPGDGTFQVYNTKYALQEFKKLVEKLFPGSDKLPTGSKGYGPLPKPFTIKADGLENGATGKDADGDLWHTNAQILVKGKPYVPFKSHMPEEKAKDLDSRTADVVKMYTLKPKEGTTVTDIKFLAMDKNGNMVHQPAGGDVSFQGVSDRPIKTVKDEVAFVRLTGENGATVDISQKYYVYAREHYPDAVIRFKDEKNPVNFVQDGEIVAVVMPVKSEGKVNEAFESFGVKSGKVKEIPHDDQVKFTGALGAAADTPQQLRPPDVDRVMAFAHDNGYNVDDLADWLISHQFTPDDTGHSMSSRTIQMIKDWRPDNSVTLDFMGLQQAYESLSKIPRAVKSAIPHLETLGKQVFTEGRTKYQDFVKGMKEKLGDLWQRFKSLMEDVWDKVRRMTGNQHGSVGDNKAEFLRKYNGALDKAEEAVKNRDEAGARKWLAEADALERLWEGKDAKPGGDEKVDMEGGLAHKDEAEMAGVLQQGDTISADASPRTTSIKNAVTEGERAARGLGPIEVEWRRSFPHSFEAAKRRVDSGEFDPRLEAKKYAEKPRALSTEEEAAFEYDRMRLYNDHHTVMGLIDKAVQSGDQAAILEGRQRLAVIEDDISDNDYVARRSGYEAGHSLSFRRMLVKQDYTLARSLQRARAATGEKEIPEDLRKQIETLTQELEAAVKKSQEYEEKLANIEAQRVVSKQEPSPAAKRREKRAVTREELDSQFKSLAGKLRASLSTLSMNFNPEQAAILGEMMKIRVQEGITKVGDIVDDIYAEFEGIPDVSKRDIRDAISNYGKSYQMSQEEIQVEMREIRRQMRLVSGLEDAKQGIPPAHSGLQRDPVSDEVRDLTKQIHDAMRESGIDKQRTPEERWKSALDSAKTRLKNEIADLDKQIEVGKRTRKDRTPLEYDKEAKRLQKMRDAKRDVLDKIDPKPNVSDEQRVKAAIAATEKSISELERRIKKKDLSPAAKATPVPETPELKALREKRDALAEKYKQMQRDAKPPKNLDEIANRMAKTRYQTRLKELQRMIDTGNYEKRARRVLKMDPEAQRLKAEVEKKKEAVDTAIRRQAHANRTPVEKGLDWAVKWRRAVILSSIQTVGKLTAAATMRQITTPIEDLIEGGLSLFPGLSRISAKAPREGGGLNVRAEAAAFSQWFKKQTWQDIKDVAITGRGELDRLYGSKKDMLPTSALDFFGRVHGALKVTPKRAEFYRSLQKRTEWAMRNGYDMSDPVTVATITADAYIDANRAIFMQDNFVIKGYRIWLNYLKTRGDLGKATAAGMQMMTPIVKIPTNFVAELTSYAFGAAKGSARVAFSKGIENLTPEEADYVMRAFKKQGLGLAMLAIGYFAYEAIGGYYQRGEKRKAGEVKEGELRLGKFDVPKFALHTPALEILQLGATIHRVQDQYAASDEKNEKKIDEGKKEAKGSGTGAGIFAGAKGIAEQVPFFEQPVRMAESTRSEASARTWANQFAESLLMPPDIRRISKYMDRAGDQQIPREQKEFWSQVMRGDIPGQRKNLPVDIAKVKKMQLDQLAEIMENAPGDVVDQIQPVFRTKFRRAHGLSDEERDRYLELIK